MTRSSASAEAKRSWLARFAAEFPLKIRVLLGLTFGICVPYFVLQRVVWFPIRRVPETPLDAWIPFDPAWAYPYASIALLVPLLPLLANRRDDLERYARRLPSRRTRRGFIG